MHWMAWTLSTITTTITAKCKHNSISSNNLPSNKTQEDETNEYDAEIMQGSASPWQAVWREGAGGPVNNKTPSSSDDTTSRRVVVMTTTNNTLLEMNSIRLSSPFSLFIQIATATTCFVTGKVAIHLATGSLQYLHHDYICITTIGLYCK